MNLATELAKVRVVPVLTILRVEDALPLAEALVAGGLSVLEVTLRTEVALSAIAAMVQGIPDAIVGAGTVTRPEDFAAIAEVGARFAVSPGFTAELAHASRDHPTIPFLPGVATASELMAATAAGFDFLKFFPAESSGGIAALKALAAPFPHVRFCPTGGIGIGNAARYLARANVVAVGGSWVAPPDAISAADWDRITALAASAQSL